MTLIAHYPLTGNTEDYSGNGNHATNYGATIDNNGKIGQCYSFTQTGSDGINIPNKNFTDLYDFTFTAWINPAGNHYHYDGAIISSGNWNSNHWSFGIRQNNNGFSCRAPVVSVESALYDFEVNKWHFVVYKREGKQISLYANNTPVYTGEVSSHTPLVSSASNTMIGRETYGSGYFSFNGKINDVRIYNHALSEKEVKEISKAKILHYTFNDFQEATSEANGLVRDISNYKNDGIIEYTSNILKSNLSRLGNNCGYFDGISKITSNQLFYDNLSQSWTVSAWVNLSDNTIGSQYLNNFNLGNRITYSTSRKALLYINRGTNDSYTYSSGIIPENEWIHVAFALNTSTLRCQIYLNGEEYGTSSNYGPTDIPYGFSSSTIFGEEFEGYLDDIRIYATDLSSEDIKKLYQSRYSLDSRGNLYINNLKEGVQV